MDFVSNFANDFILENAHFKHANGPLFRDISLALDKGTLACILGPNGSGKTSLIRALAGIIPLQEGSLLWQGENLQKRKRKDFAKIVTYVPQLNQSMPLSVYDAILMGRTPYMRFAPSREDKNIVEEIIERFSLTDWRHRFLDELSGGERQKVLIAKAIAQCTPIIILDEPTNNLDLRYQLELYNLMYHITKEEGKIILIAEHDLNLAARYADTVFIMDKQKLVAQGVAHEVITKDLLHTVYGVYAEIEKDGDILHIKNITCV